MKKPWLLLLALAPSCAGAGITIGPVERLEQLSAPISGGKAFLMLTVAGTPSSPPGCAQLARYTIELSTPHGRQQAQLAAIATATGQTLRAIGTGTCSTYGGAEDLAELDLFAQ